MGIESYSEEEALMSSKIRVVENGTVTTPVGFSSGATYAGLKTYAVDKLDLGILFSDRICSVAGVFTTSDVRSPSVVLTESRILNGQARALVVNSGIANACVGDQGYTDALEATLIAANNLTVDPEDVLICSTGIIGVELPMALIRAGLNEVQLSTSGGNDLARSIVTTDSFTKQIAVSFQHEGATLTIGGVAKGSGMINPNMATMLCFLTTDASVDNGFLKTCLSEVVDSTFNMLSIDGDTSTNDSTIIFCNGASETTPIKDSSPEASIFREALGIVCRHLTKEIARDGEGATKLIEVKVEGADSTSAARAVAKTVVSSTLVKSCIHGADPNWGRIIAAVGRSGAGVKEGRIGLYINDVCLMENGRSIPFHKDGVVVLMQNPEVYIRISLGTGSGFATAWGCDLTEEYVTFNSAYTT